MPHETITIATADGQCPAHLLTPAGTGPWTAVIIYMDAFGMRPALIAQMQGLADAGYCVLVPDMLYRFGAYGPLDPAEVFQSGNLMGTIGPMMATTGNRPAARDTAAFLDYLAGRPDVARLPAGVAGFCMGGGMALTAAATHPDRIAAVASFHGGRLATDAEDSPHLLAPRLKAHVLIAGADADDSYPLAMHERLVAAFDAAGVKHDSSIYEGALHGWMMRDFPVYHPEQAARGWQAMLDLFARTLGHA